jgi:hypothetical protein
MSAFRSFPPPEPTKTHEHTKACPITGKSHGFCPAQPGDKRAPCPALNALANHGYLYVPVASSSFLCPNALPVCLQCRPRNGRNVGFGDFVSALRKGYGLTLPLSIFLTFGTYVLLKKFPRGINLDQVAEHNKIEHDASLAHKDNMHGQIFAPLELDHVMWEECLGWMLQGESKGKGKTEEDESQEQEQSVVRAEDIARARVQREKRSAPLNHMRAEIARGEMVIALLMFTTPSSLFKGAPEGIPTEWLKEWFVTERMPLGGQWRPNRSVGLLATVKKSKEIRLAMVEQRRIGGENVQPAVLWRNGVTNGGRGPSDEEKVVTSVHQATPKQETAAPTAQETAEPTTQTSDPTAHTPDPTAVQETTTATAVKV